MDRQQLGQLVATEPRFDVKPDVALVLAVGVRLDAGLDHLQPVVEVLARRRLLHLQRLARGALRVEGLLPRRRLALGLAVDRGPLPLALVVVAEGDLRLAQAVRPLVDRPLAAAPSLPGLVLRHTISPEGTRARLLTLPP